MQHWIPDKPSLASLARSPFAANRKSFSQLRLMTITTFQANITLPNRKVVRRADWYKNSVNSLRRNPPKGQLVLRQNPFVYKRDELLSFEMIPGKNGSSDVWVQPEGANLSRSSQYPPEYPGTSNIDNVALARFSGKIRKGSAAFGMTLASWGQSRDMIAKRSGDAIRVVDRAFKRLKGDRAAVKRLARQREPAADEVLEVIFGWLPLFQDIYAAMYTVVQDAIPPQYVRAAHDGVYRRVDHPQNNGPYQRFTREWETSVKSVVAANVQISNPNLWLLNRMGLINPATVIWDKIPWSFVVNMFVNVNQVVSSFTDEVGLTVTDRSITRTIRSTYDYRLLSNSFYPGMYLREKYLYREKNRTVGQLPAVKWQVRVPNLDWGLAVIATSLLVQKSQTLNRLIKGL